MHHNHSERRLAPATLTLDRAGELVEDGPLSINVVRERGALTLEVCGEVDVINADTLDAELARAECSDADRIVLDLSGVGFIDSSGLRVLLLATQRSARGPDRLGIIRGTGQVSRVLAMTGIDESLKLLDSGPPPV